MVSPLDHHRTTYHAKPSELSPDQTRVLDDALNQLKEKHGVSDRSPASIIIIPQANPHPSTGYLPRPCPQVSFEPGYNPGISYVKGNLDTMKYSHRPFTLYVMVKLFQLLAGERDEISPAHRC